MFVEPCTMTDIAAEIGTSSPAARAQVPITSERGQARQYPTLRFNI